MFDWKLRYGENQQSEMRSGYQFATEELARKNGEDFIKETNKIHTHYPNPIIEVIEIK